ncbi:MAG: hypothetical protein L0H73_05475 [Nitrococcus sp.]|nr:hypothetical protein [Nitrococcus sp.]
MHYPNHDPGTTNPTPMTRIARIVIPGIPHHVTQRGNRRHVLFADEDDYAVYRALLRNAAKHWT